MNSDDWLCGACAFRNIGTLRACDMCDASVNLLVRCQLGPGKEWSMVCGKCWGRPEVAGGVVDGSGENEHYRYGGLWKNHHQPA